MKVYSTKLAILREVGSV